MKLLLAALLLTCLASAQVSSVIKDKETGEPVPYVNIFVEGENAGTTANEAGSFTLTSTGSGKMLILTAIGYSTLRVPADNLPQLLYLSPAPIQLNEVMVNARRENLELHVGKFRKRDIEGGFACGRLPWMVGRFFPYDAAYSKTPFLKSIALETHSQIKGAVLNIRLYLPDSDGRPGQFLYNEIYSCISKKAGKYRL